MRDSQSSATRSWGLSGGEAAASLSCQLTLRGGGFPAAIPSPARVRVDVRGGARGESGGITGDATQRGGPQRGGAVSAWAVGERLTGLSAWKPCRPCQCPRVVNEAVHSHGSMAVGTQPVARTVTRHS